jgi:hypothetical protein
LVRNGVPFGSGLSYRRFFASALEAARYVSFLHAVYKNRKASVPAPSAGQLSLF